MKALKFNQTAKQRSKKSGFTIIEVVLVLAIAGLIFLMVFIALPALQRNQRDAQRKNDMDRLLTSVQNYQSNNRGTIPRDDTQIRALLNNYIRISGEQFEDPNGKSYFVTGKFATVGSVPTISSVPAGAGLAASDDGRPVVHYLINARCSGESTIATGQQNSVSIQIILEGGGVYCVNN